MAKNKYLTTKSLIAIGIPLTVIAIQALIRISADKDFNGIGITLSSIGIGQIFPFIIFESFLLSKIFGLKEESQYISDGKIAMTYKIENKADLTTIKEIRLLSYGFFLLIILLFITTIVLNLKGEIGYHILTGLLSCILAWYYNIAY